MSNSKLIPFIIVLIGVIGVVGIWNYRYNLAYNVGQIDGYKEGNHTGTINGYSSGNINGSNDGYQTGFEKGKEKGKIDGYEIGYEEGYQNGENTGYDIGFNEGNSTGFIDGYYAGILSGSKGFNLRDPTFKEAIHFIQRDDTDKLAKSYLNYSNNYLLNCFKKNAYNQGFRCLWVTVETVGLGSNSRLSFCAFNTTDRGLITISIHEDIFIELVVGRPCFDRKVWEPPSYDDTITKIEFTP